MERKQSTQDAAVQGSPKQSTRDACGPRAAVKGAATMSEAGEAVLVREWDSDAFHKRVAELEAQGWVFREESYRITAEIDPENGAIQHLHTIEMSRGDQ